MTDRMMGCRCAYALAALMCLLPSAVMAQESRAEAIEQAQAEKKKDVHPYEPPAAERIMSRVERGLLFAPTGPYPWFGSVLRGGGLAAGPGYRQPFGDTGALNVFGAWSIKSYKTIDAHVHLPEFASGRVVVDLRASWIDAPRVAYYGLGNSTTKSARTSFDYEPTVVGANVGIRPVRFLEIGGGLDYLSINTGPGKSGTSIEERFTTETAPGLGLDPEYLRSRVYAQIDSRTSPAYTRRGGLYRAEFADYHQDGDGYNFNRLDLEARHFIPILRENWVIALRGLVSLTDAAAGEDVPYFLLPSLGGGSDLRSFSSFRFRDRNRMLLSAEYRWTPSDYLDMALFYDAGKVVADQDDLDTGDLKRSYGIGARFHTPWATVLRIEYAHGNEGGRLVFGTGPSF